MLRRRAMFPLLLLLVSCAAMQGTSIVDRIYFGRSIPGGGMVSDAECDTFVREVVTPRFPEGLTLWRGEGQWRSEGGEIVREPVLIVEIVHPEGEAPEKAVREISDEYRRRFHQEAVLRVKTRAVMELVR